MASFQAKFKQGFGHQLFLLGDKKERNILLENLKGLDFLYQASNDHIFDLSVKKPFIVILCNLENQEEVATVIRCMIRLKDINAYKILYMLHPSVLNLEHLIFSIQLGCQFISYGKEKYSLLRTIIKNMAYTLYDESYYQKFEIQISDKIMQENFVALSEIRNQLLTSAKTDINSLKLLVKIAEYSKEYKKVASYLKKILQINPQDLWAACSLAKLFVKQEKANEGILTLKTESHFITSTWGQSNLNSKLLTALPTQDFSKELLCFLNYRAFLAVKCMNIDEGIAFYKLVLLGSKKDKLGQARALYNCGICYLKLRDIKNALMHFEESFALGNKFNFTLAKRPLEKISKFSSRLKMDFSNSDFIHSVNPMNTNENHFSYDDWDLIA